jgi:chaperonin GroEL
LVRAAQAINLEKFNEGERWGAKIIKRACEEPLRQIAGNAGLDGAIVLDRVLSNKSTAWGFNALVEEYSDLVKDGVIDPVKVVRCALENAASVASLMLTTETMIANVSISSLQNRITSIAEDLQPIRQWFIRNNSP